MIRQNRALSPQRAARLRWTNAHHVVIGLLWKVNSFVEAVSQVWLHLRIIKKNQMQTVNSSSISYSTCTGGNYCLCRPFAVVHFLCPDKYNGAPFVLHAETHLSHMLFSVSISAFRQNCLIYYCLILAYIYVYYAYISYLANRQCQNESRCWHEKICTLSSYYEKLICRGRQSCSTGAASRLAYDS